MEVPVYVVFALIAVGVKAQGIVPGFTNQMSSQGNQITASQGSHMMSNQGPHMMSNHGPQMMSSHVPQMMSNQSPQMAHSQGYQMMSGHGPQMIPGQSHHVGPVTNQAYPQGNNMYSHKYISQNGAYGNQQGASQGEQSAMSLMPFIFGGDRGRRFAMMNMMMNPKQEMNSMAPWLLMDGGMEGGMWPLMAMTNNRRSKINPLMMMAAGGMM